MLGTLRVLDGDRDVALGGPRQQLVLAVLIQAAGSTVATSTLVDSVWGSQPPSSARKTAQVYVSRLRHELGGDRLAGANGGYRLALGPDDVDAWRFEGLAQRARERLASDPRGARQQLEDALGLWRGMPWGELGEHDALQPDVVRLTEQRLLALEDRIEADLELGRARAVVGELEGLVAGRPLREGLRAHLMLALHRSGQSARALEVYDEGRRILGEELGADPSPMLQELHAQILRQDPRLAPDDQAGPAVSVSLAEVANPYRGLEPFRRRDAAVFFGRNALVHTVRDRLVNDRLVAVVGPSGSGKSSVVRAGVLPALDGEGSGWQVATFVPGADPFAGLAGALGRIAAVRNDQLDEVLHGDTLDVLRLVLAARPDGRLLVVLDQFEELFLVTPDALRERFVEGLIEALDDPSSDVSVLVTLRADFLHQPLAHPAFGGRLQAGLVTVPPLTAAGVEQACTGPAAAAGVRVEPELVAELVAAVTHQPGGLPLFQYALTQLFDERAGDVLTKAALDGMGGMRGILARRAEDVHDGLDESQRALARQVFLRLVVLGEGAQDTRRRVSRRELGRLPAGRQAVDLVLERFGRARLLTLDRDDTTGEATVEVAHEALLHAWPRLRGWIDEARDDLRLHHVLSAAALEWHGAERHADFLLTGTRLAQFDEWEPASQVVTTSDEDVFLTASRERHKVLVRKEEERRVHEQELEARSIHRLRQLVGVLIVALVVGAGLTATAMAQRRAAVDLQVEAQVAAQLARARELSAVAVANRQRDPDLAVNLAWHAVHILALADQEIPTDVVASVHWSLQAAGARYPVRDGRVAVLDGPDGPRGVFDVSPEVLMGMGEAVVARELTAQECAEYLGTTTCPEVNGDVVANASWQDLDPPVDDSRPLAGTTVRLVASGLQEFDAVSAIAALRAETGIQIEVDNEPLFWEDLRATGTPISPGLDVGTLSQPAAVLEFGKQGALVDLSAWIPTADLHRDLTAHLVGLGSSSDGQVWGLPFTVNNKSLVWYPIPEFVEAGYEVPTTWTELEVLVDRIEADGRVPWCHGEEDGDASGWPGTDWIEDILLQTEGQATYDAWVSGELPFSSPPVRRAFEQFDELVLAPGRVHRGREAVAELWHVDAKEGLLTSPASCMLFHKPSFVFTSAHWGTEVDAFPLPTTRADGARAVVGGAYLVALNDRPEVRAMVELMVGPAWAEAQASEQYLSVHRNIDTSIYPEYARVVANSLRGAVADGDGVRFDGSDLMPAQVNEAFWAGMVRFVGQGPDNLNEVLADIDAAWAEVEDNGPD